MSAINAATASYEEKPEDIAKDHNVKIQRVKQLALHAPPITRKRKVSDWNIMVHFKGKQLNDGEPLGVLRIVRFLANGFWFLLRFGVWSSHP